MLGNTCSTHILPVRTQACVHVHTRTYMHMYRYRYRQLDCGEGSGEVNLGNHPRDTSERLTPKSQQALREKAQKAEIWDTSISCGNKDTEKNGLKNMKGSRLRTGGM